MPRQTLALACLFVFASITANAQGRIYTWTDAQGVVHYSQTAPENGNAQVREFNHHTASTVPANTPAQAQPKNDNELSCERATTNLARLNQSGALAIDRDGDGKTEIMTAEERAAAQALAQRQVGIFCTKK